MKRATAHKIIGSFFVILLVLSGLLCNAEAGSIWGEKCRKFFKEGNYSKSLANCQKWLKEDEFNCEAYLLIAKNVYRMGNHQFAKEIVENALETTKGNCDRLIKYGIDLGVSVPDIYKRKHKNTSRVITGKYSHCISKDIGVFNVTHNRGSKDEPDIITIPYFVSGFPCDFFKKGEKASIVVTNVKLYKFGGYQCEFRSLNHDRSDAKSTGYDDGYTKLEKFYLQKAKRIPASKIEENIRVYLALSKLRPQNREYKRKLAYYKKLLIEKQRREKKARELRKKQRQAQVKLARQKKIDMARKAGVELLVLDWRWSLSGSGNFVKVVGEVENISAVKLNRVCVYATFYDKQGRLITTDMGMVDFSPLMPGQSSPFKLYVRYNPLMHKCSLRFGLLWGKAISAVSLR